MRPPINYGPGVAPAITATPGGWRLAIGDRPGLEVLELDPAGGVVGVRTVADGYGFPTLDGAWLGYKGTEAAGWAARLINVASTRLGAPGGARRGRSTASSGWSYDPAGGNFPVVLGAGYFAWQTPDGYPLYRVPLDNPAAVPIPSGAGAPDGLAWIEAGGLVRLIKDVRFSVAGLLNPQGAGGLIVGEQPDTGPQYPLGLAIACGDYRGWIDGGICNTPRIAVAADGESFAICAWGDVGVRVWLATRAELLALPTAPAYVPTPIPPIPPEPIPVPPEPGPEPPNPEPPDPGPLPPEPEPMPTTERVALRGMAGLYLRVIPGSKGSGPFEGYQLAFDTESPNPDCEFELTLPDTKYAIRAVAADTLLGADATGYAADLCSQLYTIDHRGGYESWTVVELPSGLVVGLIEFIQAGGYPSVAFTVVPYDNPA